MVEVYLNLFKMIYEDEVKPAFEGLADEHVWQRPASGVLSIGELAGHIAYWEVARFVADDNEDSPTMARYSEASPLVDRRFRYYSTNIETLPSEAQRAMTADQVCKELLRVHEEAIADFTARNPDLASTPPGLPAHHIYEFFVKYMVFHVSYHIGQIYSVRHFFGEQTPDN